MRETTMAHTGRARFDIYGVPTNVTFIAEFGRRQTLRPASVESTSIEFREYPLCAELGSSDLKEYVEQRICDAITKPFDSNIAIEWEYEADPLKWA